MARDFLYPPTLVGSIPQYIGQPASGPLASHPYVSPVYASTEQWRGALGLLGPEGLMVLAGEYDILLPDIQHLADKARAAGPKVQLHVEPDAIHDYPLMPTPDQERHLKVLSGFIGGAVKAWYAGSK